METKKQKQEKIEGQIKVIQGELEEINKLCDKCGVNKYTKIMYGNKIEPQKICGECLNGGSQ